MQCFQAGEDMLLFGTRVLQDSPPGYFPVLLHEPQAEQERTVPHFFCDHDSLLFPHTHCVHPELRGVLCWLAGKTGYPLTRLPSSAWQIHLRYSLWDEDGNPVQSTRSWSGLWTPHIVENFHPFQHPSHAITSYLVGTSKGPSCSIILRPPGS